MPKEPELSPVLIFGIAGRIGSGASFVAEQLRHTLYSFNYEVEVVDISSLILLLDQLRYGQDVASAPEQILDSLEENFRNKYPDPAKRTRKLQELANELRKNFGGAILISAATSKFIRTVLKRKEDTQKRRAFIIDSLKHPDEVHFLQDTFRDAFYMIGVTSSDRRRLERLQERKGYSRQSFEEISEIDAKQSFEHGQKTCDTVLLSDYIVSNEYSTKDEIHGETERLVSLIFGSTIISPRKDEFAMGVAFKAAKQSACLSRQVGAAILNAKGQLIATGCNDVPQFMGGLYDVSSREDMRCWARGGKCYNDEEKQEIAASLRDKLVESGLLKDNGDETKQRLLEVISSSRVKQLLEFSRSVHAEMDAIINVARTGVSGLIGSTLYCTTYPCHGCAKHIVDAGIIRVIYFEPYEKRLAIRLHSDAINDSSERQRQGKVDFDVYGGVSPSRYEDFFSPSQDRKRAGKYVDHNKSRQSLIPIGAPFAEELWRRLEKIGGTLDEYIFEERGETTQ